MMRKYLAACLLLFTVALTGCGNTSDGGFVFTGTNPPVVPDDGTFRVQFTNVNEPGATTILVQALDSAGNLVFGPVTLPFSPTFGGDLPDNAREIQVAFGDDNGTICVFQQRLLGGDVEINDPFCLEVDDFVESIDLEPATATIAVGDTQPYTVTANLVDGSSADITGLVPLASSDPSVATEDDSIATGVSEGTTTISTGVFFFTDTASLTVEEGEVFGFSRIPLNFEDISETGTSFTFPEADTSQTEEPVTGDTTGGTDDGAVFIELPFNFSLLGDTFDSVWMCTNGFLSTGANDSYITQYEPAEIANTDFEDQPHNLIAALFTDQVLDFFEEPPVETVSAQIAEDELGTLTFEVRGEAPSRRAIFQWDVRPYDFVFPPEPPNVLGQVVQDPSIISYQIKLFETTNRIEFHYQDIEVDGLDMNDQADGTLVGVMNNAGTDALTWLFNGAPEANQLQSGDALRYVPLPPVTTQSN